MGAISKNYTLKQTLKLAINSSVDLLLFANQISRPLKIEEIISCVVKLVESGEIDIKMIEDANKRIDKLKRGLR
jgi:beta-N-acetylhexosaminidase